MSQSAKIVEALLEMDAIRVCAACQQERGIRGKPGESHGTCRRHTIQLYGVMFAPGDLESRPDDAFPPDMNEQQPQAA